MSNQGPPWKTTRLTTRLEAERDELREINAELVEALEDVSEHLADLLHGLCSWEPHEVDDRLSVARAALKRARGGGDDS